MNEGEEAELTRMTANDAYSRLDRQIEHKSAELATLLHELEQNRSDFHKLVGVLKAKITLRIPQDKAKFDETKLLVLMQMETIDALVAKVTLLRQGQIASQTDRLAERSMARATELSQGLDEYYARAKATSPAWPQRVLGAVLRTQLVLLVLVVVMVMLL